MSVLVADPFDGMAPGVQAVPPGWACQGGPGFAFAYGTVAPFAPSGGVWSPAIPHQYYSTVSSVILYTPAFAQTSITYSSAYRLLSSNNTPTVSLVDVLMRGNGGPGQSPSPVNGQYTFRCMYVFLEEDLTFSIRTSGGVGVPDLLMDNSGAPTSGHPSGYPLNTWYFLQLEVALSYISFGGNNFVKVGAQLYIDGVKVCDSANGSTYQSGSGFPLNMSGVFASELANTINAEASWVGFNTPGSTNFNLSDFEVDSGLLGGVPPNPGNPAVRISQFPIEYAALPTDGNVRVSQMPVEWAKLPQTANVRVSQMVIEVATMQTIPASRGIFPEYYKRHGAPGNS